MVTAARQVQAAVAAKADAAAQPGIGGDSLRQVVEIFHVQARAPAVLLTGRQLQARMVRDLAHAEVALVADRHELGEAQAARLRSEAGLVRGDEAGHAHDHGAAPVGARELISRGSSRVTTVKNTAGVNR